MQIMKARIVFDLECASSEGGDPTFNVKSAE